MNNVDIDQRKALVVDGERAILGRLASKIAKMLLKGEKIILINAEDIIISGKPRNTLKKYQEWRNVSTLTNPLKGPFHYRRPDLFVKRRIRGMLPWKKKRGKTAYDNLRVYIGVPDKYKDVPTIQWEDVQENQLASESKRITVKELCDRLK